MQPVKIVQVLLRYAQPIVLAHKVEFVIEPQYVGMTVVVVVEVAQVPKFRTSIYLMSL